MRRRRVPLAEGVAVAAVVGALVAFTLLPAGILFAQSVAARGGGAGLLAVAADPATHAALDQSLVQGGLSAALAVVLGYPAGVFLGRYAWRGRAAVRAFLLLPFLLPTLVVVLGLLELFGPSGILSAPFPALGLFGAGIPGVVAANLVFNLPLVALFTSAGCENAPSDLEETIAALGGSPTRAYLDAWAGPSWTGSAVGGLLTFVFSALSFAPPLLLCRAHGCATVEVRVWQLGAGATPDPASAGVLGFVLVLAFLLPASAYFLLARRLARVPATRAREPPPVPWRRPLSWGLAVATTLLVGAEALLCAVVLLRSVVAPGGGTVGRGWTLLFSPSVGARLGIGPTGLLGNSLLFASVAAGLALAVALVSAFAGARRPAASYLLGLVTFVPVLLSPVVLAFALERTWGPALGGAPNVWILICLSQALLGLPFALQSLDLPLAGISPAVRESAQALGASSWGAFVDAELPRLAPGMERATLFALALGLGEFTATLFLVTPSFTTLPVAVYALETRGLVPASAAAAALLLLLSAAVYAATSVGVRRAAG